MKSVWRSVAWILPLMLAGCFHKQPQVINQPLAPPIEDTPNQAPVPSPPASELPPPVITQPADTTQTAQTTAPEKPAETETPKPQPRRHKAPNRSTQVASSGSESVSAIGQLTSGDGGDLRSQTDSSIQATERGLKSITRSLNDQEQRVVAQIQEFLKQARTALGSGDVHGASTVAKKAKVLLDE